MSEPLASNDRETTAKRFRGHVFKPAEGVFLFHPRAMERLITEHLSAGIQDLSIPELDYYLMPTAAFLTGLETENPEALAVIEGLNLPSYVILLPMPPEQRLDQIGFTRLLREYWARRFEGDVARTWQSARDDDQDLERFGPTGLKRRIGHQAFAEVRDILIRDGVIPSGVDDLFVCRSFIALLTRLRYFSPGVRGFLFPSITDWRALDHWLISSGLDLPESLTGTRLPRLLERARPDQRCGAPGHLLLLPPTLPYGASDPDLARAEAALQAAAGGHLASGPSAQSIASSRPLETLGDAFQQQCLDALHDASQIGRSSWRTRWRDRLIGLAEPLLDRVLILAARLRRRQDGPLHGLLLKLHLILFSAAIRSAQRGELMDQYALSLTQLGLARRRYRAMRARADIPPDDPIESIIAQRALTAEAGLTHLLAINARLNPTATDELRGLIERLAHEVIQRGFARPARLLLQDLQRVLNESRTTYYRLRPGRWLRSRGRLTMRQVMPFQAQLKAMRSLEIATRRIDQLGWPMATVERYARPLRQLADQLGARLAGQLRPHLDATLREADFIPANHREEVAANKMREELLDVIQRRRHLKFTDMRDIVARNILRLPDPTLEELRHGDHLARFDRLAAESLPGVYTPGEIYIKGLQKLSAPLFGTPRGRLVLRHLIVPLGIAFLGLKTIDLLAGLILPAEQTPTLATLWSSALLAVLINLTVHTRIGRWLVKHLWLATRWALRLFLFDGLRRLVRWGPVARVLATNLIRGLDRNLVQPLFIGVLLVLPVIGAGHLIDGLEIELGLSSFLLAYAIGSLIRNTPAGRHMLDNAVSATRLFLRRLNQTLVIGLIQELLHFFKEVVRGFEQGLHWIEERISHRLGESPLQTLVKGLLAPIWALTESVIQFYVTVLVEPQVNPIKHFPLVTITHKLMLPFLPALTGLLLALTESLLPKWIALPFVTLTILLLPGLAGFLVWELKENWKIYAANHAALRPAPHAAGPCEAMRRTDLPLAPIEPAMIGSHGETMRGMLRRGFHSGTLPKAFDRLRRVLREQIRDEIPYPQRLLDARRRIAEVEHALALFCDRELVYALRRRCADPQCDLVRVTAGRIRLSSSALGLTLGLYGPKTAPARPIELQLTIYLDEPELYLKVAIEGPEQDLKMHCWELIHADITVFAGRAGAKQLRLDCAL